MATNISHSPAETEALGEIWGRTAANGLVIGLSGDLGAGKTQLVKGIARGLGIVERVHSPTFTLVNIYAGGRLTLFHLDLYRLETQEQILSAGLDEYLDPAGVTVVEWAERWFKGIPGADSRSPEVDHDAVRSRQPVPKRLRWVRLETLSESQRQIIYEDSGA